MTYNTMRGTIDVIMLDHITKFFYDRKQHIAVKEAKFQQAKMKEISNECISKGLPLSTLEGKCYVPMERWQHYKCPHLTENTYCELKKIQNRNLYK